MITRNVLAGIVFFTCAFASLVYADRASKETDVEDLISKTSRHYSIVDHLAEAEAAIRYPGKKDWPGIWKDWYFSFPALKSDAEIKVVALTFQGIPQSAVFFPPVEKGILKLRFHEVPRSRTMTLYYGIPDDAVLTGEELGYVYLRIWLGQHELKRLSIPNARGWRKEEVHLGITSFLKRNLTVDFEVTADDVRSKQLGFRAEISP